VVPIIPKEKTKLQFEAWNKTQCNPIVIYADFEALLEKMSTKKEMNTTVTHNHKPISYGFMVKASNDVPLDLLENI
jgi:hypothetical protein